MSQNILIIAAEVSGDHHASEMLRQLAPALPGTRFWGIGGDELQQQGMEIIYHVEKMSFMGIGEVLRHLPFIFRVKNDLLQRADADPPRCAILVDYPGFNLRMARALKERGIPVIYYISPQLWAWGGRRIKKIRRDVEEMLVLFPFEERFYAGHGIKARYVGHPLVDKHYQRLPETDKTVDPQNIRIGLLPGSRRQEIESLLPDMVATARLLKKDGKIHRAEIVCVDHIGEAMFRQYLKAGDDFISLTRAPLAECLPRYDAVLVASGTATLECGLYAVPMVIVYRVNRLTYFLGKRLVKIDYIGLVNIVAGEELAPELIQDDFTPPRVAAELSRFLEPGTNRKKREELKKLRTLLGEPGAARQAARAILDFLKNTASAD